MITVAVVSLQDNFHRELRRAASLMAIRVCLSLRNPAELTSTRGIDAVVLHDPLPEDIDTVRDLGRVAVVAAVSRVTGSRREDGVTVVPAEDPAVVLAAAQAVALGLEVAAPELRMDGPRSSSSGEDDLTVRERQILTLAADGATNIGIGEQLGISENTVKYHLSSIYSKLGVSRRPEMVFEAIRRGLISL